MTDTYKGFSIPKPVLEDRLYYIICDEGIFDGYSKKAVIDHWKNKVDVLVRLDAIENGYNEVTLLEGVLSCPKCGALVYDVWSHTNWHKN